MANALCALSARVEIIERYGGLWLEDGPVRPSAAAVRRFDTFSI